MTSEPNRATPTALPVWRAVFKVPDATPDRVRSTLPSSVDVIAGTSRPGPTSCTTIAAYGVDRPTRIRPAKHAATRPADSAASANAVSTKESENPR